MKGRREQALDAAVRILGDEGSRALTHRRVDSAGRLPPGTTSNHFRSRAALVAGVLGHLSAAEEDALGRLAATPASPEEFIDVGSRMIGYLLGPGRTMTVARHALMTEAINSPELREPLTAQTQHWWDLLATLLIRMGATSPVTQARMLLAYIDGLLIDQLTRPDPNFDAHVALEPFVSFLLSRTQPTPTARGREPASSAAVER